MNTFLEGESEEDKLANFNKKIFKLYKFGEQADKGSSPQNHDDSASSEMKMSEKVIYSLKDLILLNQG